jgi:hypothetical protein
MREVGIDSSTRRSKSIDELAGLRCCATRIAWSLEKGVRALVSRLDTKAPAHVPAGPSRVTRVFLPAM